VAGYTLNRPNTTWFAEISRIPLLWNVTGEFFLAEKDNWTFHPTARYTEQSSRRNLQVGTLARYQAKERGENKYRLGVGAWYNFNKALVVSLDFWQKNYQFSFSYDLALGNRNMMGQTLSAFEVSLLWRNLFEREKRKFGKRQNSRKEREKEPLLTQQQKPNNEKNKDTLNLQTESQVRLDSTQKMTKQAGEANRIEQKGKLKVIIREPIEISAKKSKIKLSPLEKQFLKPIFPDKDGFLEVDKAKIYQIAQILEKNEELKIKIIIFAEKDYSETEFLKIQADDFKEKLILQGISPERIIRQNVVRKNEKNRLEWIILQK
ncbi:MAG: type IX secretion system membrane protein PorP/SprF, partial [Raineya sp.]|nr:type IX secretion system membrane protein PorP/SprF [Raineya sp.]